MTGATLSSQAVLLDEVRRNLGTITIADVSLRGLMANGDRPRTEEDVRNADKFLLNWREKTAAGTWEFRTRVLSTSRVLPLLKPPHMLMDGATAASLIYGRDDGQYAIALGDPYGDD